MDHFSWVPHGYCFNWNPYLLWSLVGSDVLIAIAYFAIPLSLLYYSRQLFHSQAFPFRFYQIIGLFCAFIVCCGISHIAEVITVFLPLYSLSVAAKAVTAIVSLVAALWLPPSQHRRSRSSSRLRRIRQGLSSISSFVTCFIDSSPYPIYCKRASDSTMIWLNRACERAIARPASSVIGLNDTNFLKDEEQAARILQNDRLVAENGEAEFIEVVPDATGQPREYYTRKFRFTDPHTNELCIGGFSLDVTDQQIAQGKLIAANEKLREKETRLSLMVLNLNLISELSVRSTFATPTKRQAMLCGLRVANSSPIWQANFSD
jgi:PAS domain-containing protein